MTDRKMRHWIFSKFHERRPERDVIPPKWIGNTFLKDIKGISDS